MGPDELGELRKLVEEYVRRLQTIDNEIETLREDRKELKEEFKQRLDIKTLEIVLKIRKIEDTVQHKDTFDAFADVVKDLILA